MNVRNVSGLLGRLRALEAERGHGGLPITSAERRRRIAELVALARHRIATYCPAFRPGPNRESQLLELGRLRGLAQRGGASQ